MAFPLRCSLAQFALWVVRCARDFRRPVSCVRFALPLMQPTADGRSEFHFGSIRRNPSQAFRPMSVVADVPRPDADNHRFRYREAEGEHTLWGGRHRRQCGDRVLLFGAGGPVPLLRRRRGDGLGQKDRLEEIRRFPGAATGGRRAQTVGLCIRGAR